MAITTVTGVVEKPVDAQRILEELQSSCLCDRSDISLLHRDSGPLLAAVKSAIDSSAAAASSVIDVLFQGGKAVARSLPGGGMLRAAGDFGLQVANAGVNTGAGIAKALVDAGLSQAEARRSADAVDHGGVLIVVQAKNENIARCVRKVLATHGATEPEPRRS